uniref:Migration and invasion inhibitory protein n=1 Tax=Astyanax mexicanus TaxID=7994 RepID=A0A3B1IXS2_ASTMX
MAFLEDLEALRKQNQALLEKLKLQSEKLQGLGGLAASGGEGGAAESGKSEPQTPQSSGEDLAAGTGGYKTVDSSEKDRGDDRVVTTVSVGNNRRPRDAREALCKPRSVKTAVVWDQKPDNITAEASTPAGHVTDQYRPSEDAPYVTVLQHQGNSRFQEHIISKRQMQRRPALLVQEKEPRGLDRVMCLSPDLDLESTSERQRMQPLLGYDWIAGLLDAESSLTERSEQFFTELRSFRQVNKDECVYSQSSGLPVVADPWLSSAEEDAANQEHAPDTHQCTFCYRINSRLFAAPLDPQAACPVCKKPKSRHPHTEQEPAFIRVSIPRSTLLPAYRYRAHRRSSFDPSDTLGLPSHCLSGWSNPSLTLGSQMSSLDLRSSMVNRPDTGSVSSAQLENQLNVSVSRAAGSQRSDQLLDVSRLARYRFQQLGPERTKATKSLCTN